MSHLSEEEALILSQENRFLKQTILSLRNELDECSREKDVEIGTAISNFEKEKRNYRKIIEKQREENERLQVGFEEEKQQISSIIP